MKKQLVNTFIIMNLLLVTCLQPANAVLERVGPVSNTPTIGGFPAWYMDTSGIALEFCAPGAAELGNGHCLLLSDNVPVVPEVFPANFFDEHFFYSAGAVFPASPVTKILWESAVESAFGGAVVAGGQITFSRIRMRLEPVPVNGTGTYIFRHPYGEETLEGTAGDRIFFTDDVGIGAPGDFSGAMTSRLGPFLLPSATSGGPELAPVAGTGVAGGGAAGKFYIADPGRVGPVTGSPILRNYVEIEGPPGVILDPANGTGKGTNFIRADNFSLMGRLYTGAIDSRVTMDRASYSNNQLNTPAIKVDVFATAMPTGLSRLPAQARPAPVIPSLSFFDTPCGVTVDGQGNITGLIAPAGAFEIQMATQGNFRWGQALPTVVPNSVCVKDNAARDAQGNTVVSYHDMPVNDLVNITAAAYDPVTKTLTVSATSSDTAVPPTLMVAEYGTPLTAGLATVTNVVAPPAKVSVLSSSRGRDAEDVVTGTGAAPGAGAPTAVADSLTTNEDSAGTVAVLANDTFVGAPTLAIVAQGSRGTASINNVDNTVTYTPFLNANGADSFTYTVTADGVTSNIATVAVTITPVNDAPVAVADTAGGAVNTPLTISVLANDSDVDGNPLTISNVSAVTGPGTVKTATVNGNGTITFNADAAGQYTFEYTVTDGSLSATASVTVTMSPAETLNVTSALFRTDKRRWVVTGTSSINSGQLVTLSFTSGNAVPCNAEGRVIGTANITGGSFTIDFINAPTNIDPRNTNCPQVKAISTTDGVDPATPIVIRR